MAGEGNLEKWFKSQCELNGVFIRKLVSPGNTGFPDRMVAYKGKVIFVELKNPNGEGSVSAKQDYTIKLMRDQDLDVCVVQSKEECEDVIRRLTDG